MDTPVTEPPSTEPPDPPGTQPPPTDPGPGIGDWLSSLHRSSSERILGGVAGGLAQRFGLPVVLVRIGFVVTAFVGIGFPVYVVAWALLPTERGDRVMGHGPVRDLVAVGAVLVAGLMLFAQLDDVDYPSLMGRAIPWLVVLGGLALLLRRADRSSGRGAPPPPPPTDPFSTSPVPPPPPGYRYTPTGAEPVVTAPRVVPTPRPARAPRPRPFVGPITWGIALVALAVMGLVELADGGRHSLIGPGPMAAVVLIVFGAGIALTAFRGRARGLLLPAVALLLGLAGLTALDVRADTFEGGFDVRAASSVDLPSTLQSAIGSNRLDLGELELTEDRTVTVRQTAGSLRIVLPRATSTRVLLDVGTGWARVERPSASTALYDTDIAADWVARGLPRDGDPLTATELDLAVSGFLGSNERSLDRDGAVFTVDHDSDAQLTIDVELGVGDVRIIDPRWTDVPDRIATPVQLCTVGGGPRGVVEPCPDVPEAQRVALCINDLGNLVDCREDRPGTVDWPRVPACRAAGGDFRSCLDLGIEPIGAELVSPVDPDDPTEDTIAPLDEPVDAEPEPAPSATAATEPTTTAAPGPVPPPTPEATVPPVPTPGG